MHPFIALQLRSCFASTCCFSFVLLASASARQSCWLLGFAWLQQPRGRPSLHTHLLPFCSHHRQSHIAHTSSIAHKLTGSFTFFRPSLGLAGWLAIRSWVRSSRFVRSLARARSLVLVLLGFMMGRGEEQQRRGRTLTTHHAAIQSKANEQQHQRQAKEGQTMMRRSKERVREGMDLDRQRQAGRRTRRKGQ